jgi:hypothetical protein
VDRAPARSDVGFLQVGTNICCEIIRLCHNASLKFNLADRSSSSGVADGAVVIYGYRRGWAINLR